MIRTTGQTEIPLWLTDFVGYSVYAFGILRFVNSRALRRIKRRAHKHARRRGTA